jgi:CheY-like chemotaxis protein
MTTDRITVLVVEDQLLLRMDIVDELEVADFRVVEAANATAAIDLLVANKAISVMFTDVDMPGGIDGLELAALVRGRWPPVVIIVTSGLHNVDVSRLPARARFLSKPYDPAVVVNSIREMVSLRLASAA